MSSTQPSNERRTPRLTWRKDGDARYRLETARGRHAELLASLEAAQKECERAQGEAVRSASGRSSTPYPNELEAIGRMRAETQRNLEASEFAVEGSASVVASLEDALDQRLKSAPSDEVLIAFEDRLVGALDRYDELVDELAPLCDELEQLRSAGIALLGKSHPLVDLPTGSISSGAKARLLLFQRTIADRARLLQ